MEPSSDDGEVLGLDRVIAVLDGSAGELGDAAGTADAVLMNVRMLGAMAAQIAAGLDGAAGEAQRAGDATTEALRSVDRMSERMTALDGLVDHIDGVVREIRSIAQHITLVSLNAAVEAAHAGVAGRGFAVVAEEVKRLAAQSSSATASITGHLSGIERAVREVGEASQVVRRGVGQMTSASRSVSAVVREQAEMARGIGSYIDEAAGSVERLSQVATRVSENIGRARDQVLGRLAIEGGDGDDDGGDLDEEGGEPAAAWIGAGGDEETGGRGAVADGAGERIP